MKSIIGWIIGIAIIWLIFSGFNSLVGSSTTTSGSSGTSTSTFYESSDNNIESNQTEEDTNTDLEFNGYPCTVDCSGHEAGFDWAEEKGITQDDVDNYSGNSDSFREGMQSYVDEN